MTNCAPGEDHRAFRPTVEARARVGGVTNKSVKLKFEPIVSRLSETIAPPGTRPVVTVPISNWVNLRFPRTAGGPSSFHVADLYEKSPRDLQSRASTYLNPFAFALVRQNFPSIARAR